MDACLIFHEGVKVVLDFRKGFFRDGVIDARF